MFGKNDKDKDDKDKSRDDKLKEDNKSPADFLSRKSEGSTSERSYGDSGCDAILGKGSKVVGNLSFSGPVEIGGYVEGEINASDRILIRETAEINARIIGAEVVVQGTVNGDIQASKKLILKKPARIFGNINSNNLSIEEGVQFEGKCSMSAAAGSDSSSKHKSTESTKVISGSKIAGGI